MQDNYFTLIERLAPDLAQEIERRALVLERIGALQPVGRRQLAARLNLPEREVRTVATLLKELAAQSVSQQKAIVTRWLQGLR